MMGCKRGDFGFFLHLSHVWKWNRTVSVGMFLFLYFINETFSLRLCVPVDCWDVPRFRGNESQMTEIIKGTQLRVITKIECAC